MKLASPYALMRVEHYIILVTVFKRETWIIRYFINVESCLKIVNSFVWFDCGALRLCYCHNIYSKSKIGIALILNQKPNGIDPKRLCMSRIFLI